MTFIIRHCHQTHILNTTQLFNISLRFFIVKHRENGISRKFQDQRFYFYIPISWIFDLSQRLEAGVLWSKVGEETIGCETTNEMERFIKSVSTSWHVYQKGLDGSSSFSTSEQRKSWLRSIRQNYPCNLFREIPD